MLANTALLTLENKRVEYYDPIGEYQTFVEVISLLKGVTDIQEDINPRTRNRCVWFSVSGSPEGFRALQFLGTVVNYFSDANVINPEGPIPAKVDRVEDWTLIIGDKNIWFFPFGPTRHADSHNRIFCTVEFFGKRRPNELARFVLDWLKVGIEEGWVVYDRLSQEMEVREKVEQLDQRLKDFGYESVTVDKLSRHEWRKRE